MLLPLNIAFGVFLKALTHGTPTPPACEAALALDAPSSLFHSSFSSPCALIRDPTSHSGTTLRHFQLLPFPFRRELLNWQLEHDPNRRTDAIRQEEERMKGGRGRERTREEEAECFYLSFFLGWRKMNERMGMNGPVNPENKACSLCVRPRWKLCYARVTHFYHCASERIHVHMHIH